MINVIDLAHYRAKQFFAALKPSLSVEDWQLVESVFQENAPALALFRHMSTADQQHAISVLRTLLLHGKDHWALQQAALLHDVGKVSGQPLIYRVAIVLLNAFCPASLRKLAQGSLTCAAWRRPFVVHAQHPQIGATWAQEAGCSDAVVTLIRVHQEKPPDHPETLLEHLHQALYEADSAN
ncbi:MAG: hypothetical protein GWO38_07410 [Phycisphaerae bacterium]|nr:hypothetical protein [Phycisphaerae bacterium]NIX27453.1 hypothetical protein [Phycisphaerae bacterium]